MRDLSDFSGATWRELADLPEFQEWVRAPTAEHQVLWNDFLRTYPHREEAVAQARAFLREVQHYYAEHSPTAAEMEFDRRRVAEKVTERRTVRRRNYRRLALAAAAILLLTVTVVALWPQPGSQADPAVVALRTDYGETRSVSLPDGSFVELNANSTLIYPANWEAGTDREVQLAGEAFFTVAPKPATGVKFTVRTKDLAVEVLGTRFNVSTYLADTEVVLNEGKIRLRLNERPEEQIAPLSPGERFRYNASSAVMERSTVNTLAFTGWKDGEYIFEDTPLGEIIDKLSAVYGVKFVLGSAELRKVKVSTTASAENLDEFLRVLQLLFIGENISVERNGDRVFIKLNNPPL